MKEAGPKRLHGLIEYLPGLPAQERLRNRRLAACGSARLVPNFPSSPSPPWTSNGYPLARKREILAGPPACSPSAEHGSNRAAISCSALALRLFLDNNPRNSPAKPCHKPQSPRWPACSGKSTAVNRGHAIP